MYIKKVYRTYYIVYSEKCIQNSVQCVVYSIYYVVYRQKCNDDYAADNDDDEGWWMMGDGGG